MCTIEFPVEIEWKLVSSFEIHLLLHGVRIYSLSDDVSKGLWTGESPNVWIHVSKENTQARNECGNARDLHNLVIALLCMD